MKLAKKRLTYVPESEWRLRRSGAGQGLRTAGGESDPGLTLIDDAFRHCRRRSACSRIPSADGGRQPRADVYGLRKPDAGVLLGTIPRIPAVRAQGLTDPKREIGLNRSQAALAVDPAGLREKRGLWNDLVMMKKWQEGLGKQAHCKAP